jgi:hypothetical protein
MHFGKIFIENSDEEIDIKSYILGIVSPDTIDDDDFEDFHCLDEDGNVDVREFYEKFDLKKLNIQQKSFILGYYCRLWFDEYYKFNASKLIIHNYRDLCDEELISAIKNIFKYYDDKAIGNYYELLKREIKNYNIKIDLKEMRGININKAKEILVDYFKELTPKSIYSDLIIEEEYIKFMKNSCQKIIKSL